MPRQCRAQTSMQSANFRLNSCWACALLASDGRVFGMFGMLDRLDGQSITEEDVRRARSPCRARLPSRSRRREISIFRISIGIGQKR